MLYDRDALAVEGVSLEGANIRISTRSRDLMSSIYGFIVRNWQIVSPPEPPKATNAVKIGILGAAKVA